VGNRIWGGAGGKSYLGWSWWETVSGSFPPIPWHWTVGISPRGERLTGRGNLFPLPCLPHSNHLTSHRPPTPPAPPALLPRPLLEGGVRAWRYQVSSRARGGAGGPPCPGLLRDLPMHWTVWISPRGGGADGEGELVPPPLSPTLQPSYFSPASLARASCRLSIRSLPAPPPRLSRGKGSARSDSRHGPCIAFSPLDRFAPPRHRRVWPPEGAMPDGGCAQASAAHSISKRFAKKEVI